MIQEIFLIIAAIAGLLLIMLLYNMKKKKDRKEIKIRYQPINKKKKLVATIIVILVLLSAIFLVAFINFNQLYDNISKENQSLNEEIESTKNLISNTNLQLNNLETELETQNSIFEERDSELQALRLGDKYNLHDPTWSEVYDFVENNDKTEASEIINDAKNLGIRSAYVMIGMEYGMYELLGFDTLDYGMVYLEPETNYLVYPEVGLNYYDCIEDQPYGASLPEYYDEILEIIIIW